MTPHIHIPPHRLSAFCERWQITELALFGSVLRDDFRPDSDIDILVEFKKEARHTLLDIVQIQEELKAMVGREVDLVERAGVEESRNHLRRRAILDSAETIYADVMKSYC